MTPTDLYLDFWTQIGKNMNNFEIEFVSDSCSEYLMVEVLYKKQRVCQLDNGGGNKDMEIEILTDLYVLDESVVLKFPLSDFKATLEEAAEALHKSQGSTSSGL